MNDIWKSNIWDGLNKKREEKNKEISIQKSFVCHFINKTVKVVQDDNFGGQRYKKDLYKYYSTILNWKKKVISKWGLGLWFLCAQLNNKLFCTNSTLKCGRLDITSVCENLSIKLT